MSTSTDEIKDIVLAALMQQVSFLAQMLSDAHQKLVQIEMLSEAAAQGDPMRRGSLSERMNEVNRLSRGGVFGVRKR